MISVWYIYRLGTNYISIIVLSYVILRHLREHCLHISITHTVA